LGSPLDSLTRGLVPEGTRQKLDTALAKLNDLADKARPAIERLPATEKRIKLAATVATFTMIGLFALKAGSFLIGLFAGKKA